MFSVHWILVIQRATFLKLRIPSKVSKTSNNKSSQMFWYRFPTLNHFPQQKGLADFICDVTLTFLFKKSTSNLYSVHIREEKSAGRQRITRHIQMLS